MIKRIFEKNSISVIDAKTNKVIIHSETPDRDAYMEIMIDAITKPGLIVVDWRYFEFEDRFCGDICKAGIISGVIDFHDPVTGEPKTIYVNSDVFDIPA